jgi:hypothetical protein
MTFNSARSCRPIAAWMFQMTIDFSRECNRLFLCTKLSPLPPSLFRSKAPNWRRFTSIRPKARYDWGALLPVLWEGNETSYVRFRTIGIYSRDARFRAVGQFEFFRHLDAFAASRFRLSLAFTLELIVRSKPISRRAFSNLPL